MAYRLEAAMLNSTVLRRVDAFQMRCLRKILRVPEVKRVTQPKEEKEIKLFSEFYTDQRVKRLAKLIVLQDVDPAAKVTFQKDTFQPHDTGTLRWARP